jgi:hypothetical protein
MTNGPEAVSWSTNQYVGGGRIFRQLPILEEYITNGKREIKEIELSGCPKNIPEKASNAVSGPLSAINLCPSLK